MKSEKRECENFRWVKRRGEECTCRVCRVVEVWVGGGEVCVFGVLCVRVERRVVRVVSELRDIHT